MTVGEPDTWELKPFMFYYGPFAIWQDDVDDWYIEMQQCAEREKYRWVADLFEDSAHIDEDWKLESPEAACRWIDECIREAT